MRLITDYLLYYVIQLHNLFLNQCKTPSQVATATENLQANQVPFMVEFVDRKQLACFGWLVASSCLAMIGFKVLIVIALTFPFTQQITFTDKHRKQIHGHFSELVNTTICHQDRVSTSGASSQ